MKKAVITILGTVGGFKSRESGKFETCSDSELAKRGALYYFEDKEDLKYENKINILNVLVDEYSKDYEIVPIYTADARAVQEGVLRFSGQEIDFDKGELIENENEFDKLFSTIDSAIKRYDEVIIDVSHGFRHLPILMTVDIVIRSLKTPKKISKILFAQQIEESKKYKIIDIKEYIDLATLAFIVTNFKDNYTLIKHTKLQDEQYENLVQCMRKFSEDILALSLENLFKNSSKKLLEEIEHILSNKSLPASLTEDIKEIQKHISKVFSYEGKKRYQTYYYLAEDMFKKGYLSNTIALLNEGVGFYLKSVAKEKDEIRVKIEEIEDKISENRKNSKHDPIYNLYTLSDQMKTMLKVFGEDRYNEKLFNYDEYKEIHNFFKDRYGEKRFNNLNRFVMTTSNTRNNLLHANTSDEFKDVNETIGKLLDQYQSFCMQ